MLKVISVSVVLLSLAGLIQAQNLESLLKDQIDAFNKQDIDRMINNVAEDIKWYGIMPDSLVMEADGKAAFHRSMSGYFGAYSTVESEIENVSISGDKISFKETVRWETENGKREQSSLAVYQYRDGLIWRVWYFY